ncbi:hypothetical protein QBC35DRAFT_449314 [Podospora australis]|uniref:Uncharacterized protein n=1 Tax=Podospora australis TaxID=1536484 RepID=A0AAN7AKJ9_9PEZI|nr:hypothetical protein QBC35DRAFT_449314 [Podospora australis]
MMRYHYSPKPWPLGLRSYNRESQTSSGGIARGTNRIEGHSPLLKLPQEVRLLVAEALYDAGGGIRDIKRMRQTCRTLAITGREFLLRVFHLRATTASFDKLYGLVHDSEDGTRLQTLHYKLIPISTTQIGRSVENTNEVGLNMTRTIPPNRSNIEIETDLLRTVASRCMSLRAVYVAGLSHSERLRVYPESPDTLGSLSQQLLNRMAGSHLRRIYYNETMLMRLDGILTGLGLGCNDRSDSEHRPARVSSVFFENIREHLFTPPLFLTPSGLLTGLSWPWRFAGLRFDSVTTLSIKFNDPSCGSVFGRSWLTSSGMMPNQVICVPRLRNFLLLFPNLANLTLGISRCDCIPRCNENFHDRWFNVYMDAFANFDILPSRVLPVGGQVPNSGNNPDNEGSVIDTIPNVKSLTLENIHQRTLDL